MVFKQFTILLLALLIVQNIEAQSTDLNVLVFSKTGVFRHKSIPTGIDFFNKMGA